MVVALGASWPCTRHFSTSNVNPSVSNDFTSECTSRVNSSVSNGCASLRMVLGVNPALSLWDAKHVGCIELRASRRVVLQSVRVWWWSKRNPISLYLSPSIQPSVRLPLPPSIPSSLAGAGARARARARALALPLSLSLEAGYAMELSARQS